MKDNSSSACDHPRVSIVGIEREFSLETRSRILRGHCHDCGATVSREQTQIEINSGTLQTKWETCPGSPVLATPRHHTNL